MSLRRLFSALLAPFALALPTHDHRANVTKIATLSLFPTTFFLFAGVYTFPGGAHLFVMYADYLAHGGVLRPDIAQRDIGYPLLLWLTGVTYTGSFIPITLVQTAFTYLLPLMIYKAIDPRFPCLAFVTALLSMASFAPYHFMKWIHHDHPYLFFTVLTALCFILLTRAQTPKHAYTMTLAAILASLTRPAGNLVYPVLLGIAALLKPRMWRHYLVCLLLFCCMLYGYYLHRTTAFDVREGKPMPSYTGIQVLYNFFVNSSELEVPLSPALGPNMQSLYAKLEASLRPDPDKSVQLQHFLDAFKKGYSEEFLTTQFKGYSASQLAMRMFTHPNYEYYQYMNMIVDDAPTYLGATWEIIRAHPWYAPRYIARSMQYFMFDPGYAHSRGNTNPLHKERIALLISGGGVWNGDILPRNGFRELSHSPLEAELAAAAPWMAAINRGFRGSYHRWVQVTMALMLAAVVASAAHFILITCLRRRTGWLERLTCNGDIVAPVIGVFGIYLYNALTTCAFVDPNYRYHYFVTLIQAIAAGFGLIVCWNAAQPLADRWRSQSNALQRAADMYGRIAGRWDAALGNRRALYIVHGGGALLAGLWVLFLKISLAGAQ